MDENAQKFAATTLIYSILTIARLDEVFTDIFQLEASPVEGQSQQQKEKKKIERKGQKRDNKITKSLKQ